MQKRVTIQNPSSSSRRAVSFCVPRTPAIAPERRTLSAGAPSNALMNPLSFEEVDLKSTPLSSLRSCSEFQQNNYLQNSNLQAVNKDASTSSFSSFFSYLVGRKSTTGSKKIHLGTTGDDERNFFVHSMTRRDDDFDSDPISVNQVRSSHPVGFMGSCVPRHQPNSSIKRYPHRQSIEESSREENNFRRRLVSTDDSILHESSAALDILFGINSNVSRLPMEIELKTIKSTTIEIRNEFLDELDLMSPVFDRGELPRLTLPSPVDRSNLDNNSTEVSRGVSPRVRVSPASSVALYGQVHDLLQKWAAVSRAWVTSRAADDALYEQLRIQPFSFGAYLRGMLWAGFSGLFFSAYSLILWPALGKPLVLDTLFSTLVYGYLVVQFSLNLIQLPGRIHLHLQCWESTRNVDVDASLALLRNMIHSDWWILNRLIGRIQDALSIAFLVLGEFYLHNSDPSSNFHALMVSICASTLLAFLMRVAVALLFSLTCHDPLILNEARRRGLSRLDLDVLPTFVFSSPDDVNNGDCSICLSDFDLGDMLISLPCDKKHSFHACCIRQWLQRQNSCPLCQRMV